jgi:hypothetical protein
MTAPHRPKEIRDVRRRRARTKVMGNEEKTNKENTREKIMKSHKEKSEKKEGKKMKSPFVSRIAVTIPLAALTISVALSSVPVSAQQRQNDQHDSQSNYLQAPIPEFEVPGAGTGAYQGTAALDINSSGEIAGLYILANNSFSAFVRHPNGKITTFNVAGAGTGANQGTIAYSINPKGEVTGYYVDGNNVNHGYLRLSDGAITSIDVPGAGTASGQGTLAFNLNSEGEIAGEYIDASGVIHGFLLVLGPGRFTSFDAPGAGTGPGQGTETASEDGLTRKGAVAGAYIDDNTAVHGLLLAADGTITTFDVIGAGTGIYQGTYPGGIDPKNTISGYYIDANSVYHGFQRRKDGAITTFDVPVAGTASGQGTMGENINAFGMIDGQYIDGNSVYHCFLFTPGLGGVGGNISLIQDVPGAGTAPGQGTFIGPMNAKGQIAGYYIDQNNLYHGYLLTPIIPLAK